MLHPLPLIDLWLKAQRLGMLAHMLATVDAVDPRRILLRSALEHELTVGAGAVFVPHSAASPATQEDFPAEGTADGQAHPELSASIYILPNFSGGVRAIPPGVLSLLISVFRLRAKVGPVLYEIGQKLYDARDRTMYADPLLYQRARVLASHLLFGQATPMRIAHAALDLRASRASARANAWKRIAGIRTSAPAPEWLKTLELWHEDPTRHSVPGRLRFASELRETRFEPAVAYTCDLCRATQIWSLRADGETPLKVVELNPGEPALSIAHWIGVIRQPFASTEARLHAVCKLAEALPGGEVVPMAYRLFGSILSMPLLVNESASGWREPFSLPIALDVELVGESDSPPVRERHWRRDIRVSGAEGMDLAGWEPYLRRACDRAFGLWRWSHPQHGDLMHRLERARITFDFRFASKLIGVLAETGFPDPLPVDEGSAEPYFVQMVLGRLLGTWALSPTAATGILGHRVTYGQQNSSDYLVSAPGGIREKLEYVRRSEAFERVVLPRGAEGEGYRAAREVDPDLEEAVEMVFAKTLSDYTDVIQPREWRHRRYLRCPELFWGIHSRFHDGRPDLLPTDAPEAESVRGALASNDSSVLRVMASAKVVVSALYHLDRTRTSGFGRPRHRFSWTVVRTDDVPSDWLWWMVLDTCGVGHRGIEHFLRSPTRAHALAEASRILNNFDPDPAASLERAPEVIVLLHRGPLNYHDPGDEVPTSFWGVLSQLAEEGWLTAVPRDVLQRRLGATRVIIVAEPETPVIASRAPAYTALQLVERLPQPFAPKWAEATLRSAGLRPVDARALINAMLRTGVWNADEHGIQVGVPTTRILEAASQLRTFATGFHPTVAKAFLSMHGFAAIEARCVLDALQALGALRGTAGLLHMAAEWADSEEEPRNLMHVATTAYRAGAALLPQILSDPGGVLALDKAFQPQRIIDGLLHFRNCANAAKEAGHDGERLRRAAQMAMRSILNSLVPASWETVRMTDRISASSDLAYEMAKVFLDSDGDTAPEHPIHLAIAASIADKCGRNRSSRYADARAADARRWFETAWVQVSRGKWPSGIRARVGAWFALYLSGSPAEEDRRRAREIADAVLALFGLHRYGPPREVHGMAVSVTWANLYIDSIEDDAECANWCRLAWYSVASNHHAALKGMGAAILSGDMEIADTFVAEMDIEAVDQLLRNVSWDKLLFGLRYLNPQAAVRWLAGFRYLARAYAIDLPPISTDSGAANSRSARSFTRVEEGPAL